MKGHRFLSILLCGCLISGSVSANTYASVLGETVIACEAEDEIEKNDEKESELEFGEDISEREFQIEEVWYEFETDITSDDKIKETIHDSEISSESELSEV